MEEFSFPFSPYPIQVELMRRIRDCIERREVGIFESPTGTGKSLSIICATLTWLEEEEKREMDMLMSQSKTLENDENDDDWVAAHRRKMERMKVADAARDELERKARIQKRIDDARAQNGRKRKLRGNADKENLKAVEEEDDDALGDYRSDEELDGEKNKEDDGLKVTKIIYASRTHSQLEQFLSELYRTRFRPRLVTAASRQTLCVNEPVKKLLYTHLINEKCMELRKTKASKKSKMETGSASSSSCPFYCADAVEDLANSLLALRVKNTNELVEQAKSTHGCPYFATRKAVPLCELILLPYQVLLHEKTRAAWGIELEGNVVVVDEAHNLLSTLSQIHSAELALPSLNSAIKLIADYLERYGPRLSPTNRKYMRQLDKLVASMANFLKAHVQSKQEAVLSISEFIIKSNLTDFNLFKLVHFMEATDVCKKFHGFFLRSNRVQVKVSEPPKRGIALLLDRKLPTQPPVPVMEVEKKKETPIGSPLFPIKTFLESLNSPTDDGRVLIEKKRGEDGQESMRFRFILLNPASKLKSLVGSARSVLLLGGTMEPSQLLVDALTFSCGKSEQHIQRFSCEHVIDDGQLVALALGRGVDGRTLTLTFETRSDPLLVSSLGKSLVEILRVTPNGAVAFFPSYDFLSFFLSQLRRESALWNQLCDTKEVLWESRGESTSLWERFVAAARTRRGAVLCAVVGGKLSEGINFSDELGRAVILFGLPYPNKNSVELKEKMKYLEGVRPGMGSMLYESLCLHSVNQAVGRAIRHRRDYAAVLLIDARWQKEALRKGLSCWIGRRTQFKPDFASALARLKTFFELRSHTPITDA